MSYQNKQIVLHRPELHHTTQLGGKNWDSKIPAVNKKQWMWSVEKRQNKEGRSETGRVALIKPLCAGWRLEWVQEARVKKTPLTQVTERIDEVALDSQIVPRVWPGWMVLISGPDWWYVMLCQHKNKEMQLAVWWLASQPQQQLQTTHRQRIAILDKTLISIQWRCFVFFKSMLL